MKTISVPIGQARSTLGELIEQVRTSGVRVLLTSHGQPQAQLLPCPEPAAPWRVATPDDPQRYGDLNLPVMEDWVERHPAPGRPRVRLKAAAIASCFASRSEALTVAVGFSPRITAPAFPASRGDA